MYGGGVSPDSTERSNRSPSAVAAKDARPRRVRMGRGVPAVSAGPVADRNGHHADVAPLLRQVEQFPAAADPCRLPAAARRHPGPLAARREWRHIDLRLSRFQREVGQPAAIGRQRGADVPRAHRQQECRRALRPERHDPEPPSLERIVSGDDEARAVRREAAHRLELAVNGRDHPRSVRAVRLLAVDLEPARRGGGVDEAPPIGRPHQSGVHGLRAERHARSSRPSRRRARSR